MAASPELVRTGKPVALNTGMSWNRGLTQALRAGVERERSQRSALTRPAARPLFLSAGTPGMPWTGSIASPGHHPG